MVFQSKRHFDVLIFGRPMLRLGVQRLVYFLPALQEQSHFLAIKFCADKVFVNLGQLVLQLR